MTPDYIKRKIRQRFDLDEHDTSMDESIERMTPHERLEHVCAWEQGSTSWADTFVMWATDCGYIVKEKEE